MAKQIAQFNKVFFDKYCVRAIAGMTIDQVVILASVIQKEANPSESRKSRRYCTTAWERACRCSPARVGPVRQRGEAG